MINRNRRVVFVVVFYYQFLLRRWEGRNLCFTHLIAKSGEYVVTLYCYITVLLHYITKILYY